MSPFQYPSIRTTGSNLISVGKASSIPIQVLLWGYIIFPDICHNIVRRILIICLFQRILHYSLKMLSFLQGLFVKNQVAVGTWTYICFFFNLIFLINASVYMPELCCLITVSWNIIWNQNGDASRNAFVIQDCFGYPKYSIFPHEFGDFFFNFSFELESCCITLADSDLVFLSLTWHLTLRLLRLYARTTMPDSSNEVFLKVHHILATLVMFPPISFISLFICLPQNSFTRFLMLSSHLHSSSQPTVCKHACIETLLTLLRDESLAYLKPYELSTMIPNVVLASLLHWA